MSVDRRRDAPKRRFSGTWSTMSTLLRKMSQMSEGRRSQVVLLDERRLDIIIQSRLYGGELLDIVASHFNLKEKEYFGISYVDEHGQHSWLYLDKRVLEHDFPKKSTSQGATLVLYFRIKYYVESITLLRDSATIEAFYLQTKSLISKGDLEIDSDIIFQLAALVIQATYGDYTDDQIFRSNLKRLPVLPTFTLKEFPSISSCETLVLDHYKVLVGKTRGSAIVNYLSIVESLPTYGQHYYEVKDKSGNPCWLSLSYRGISQYDKADRRNPRRVFLWKQLENLYFRDKKFTIEVHEARRVVHTLSSFNLYEDAIEEPVEEFDDLSNAICDPTTQVSVSRRGLAPASVTVYVWYAASSNVAKCIWSMAIAQHQFFLDRNQKKTVNRVGRSLSQIASELCKSVQSLSSASSQSNISRSNSTASLPTIIIEGELSEESKVAHIEMLSALQARKDALQDALKKKTEELKVLCLKEGEITGELPPETPFQPGEAQPQVRRRVGTSFTISDKIIFKAKGKDRETLNNLELDYEIQSKIASAAYKLANDVTARKSVRKLRKVSYQQATSKLKDIEEKLSTLKREKETHEKKVEGTSDNKNAHFLGLPTSSSENSIPDKSNLISILSSSFVPPSTSLPQLTEGICLSAPPSPSKSRHRHQSLQHVPIISDNVYEDVIVPFNLRTRRNSSSYSATSEYDAVSCGGSSIASLGIPYRNRFEANLDIEGTNHYSVPNRRASQAFNDQEDLLSDEKSEDTVSRCFMEGNQQNRYSNTPLPCSYDERLSYAKSFPLQASESNYDKASIDSNGMVNLSCGDSIYQTNESAKADTFSSHSYSENTLHRTQSGPLHFKLSHMHISNSDLNLEDINNANGIRHVYSVPTLPRSATLRPVNVFANPSISDCSGMSNQSINQVVDLVQASVLLQDCKRAASASSLEFCSPKIKTKEWIETSLDSPILSKKKKHPVAESYSKTEISQPAEWYENGLPAAPSPTNSFYNFQPPQGFYDHNLVKSDSRLLPSPPSNHVPCSSPDYQNVGPDSMFPTHNVYERSHSSRSLYSETNQYHHYENIEDLPTGNAQNFSKPEPVSHYENVLPSSEYVSNKREESEEKPFKHYLNHEDYCDSSNISKAQPQEPPKRPIRRINCFPTDDVLEVEAHTFHNSTPDETDFARCTSYAHCDIPDAPSQYSQPHFEPRRSQEQEVPAPQHVQNWQQYPGSPPDNRPVSPAPQTMSFSPSVEVNVVSVGHFQPYWEETKPYEISDFYKYSTKHRRQQKPVENANENLSEVNGQEFLDPQNHLYNANTNQGVGTNEEYSHSSNPVPRSHVGNAPSQHQELVTNSVPVFDTSSFLESPAKYYEGTPSPVLLRHPEDPDKSLSLGEVELRISLADTFHDEMVAWYQNQDSVKKATLV